jgi:hypothetical protein
MSAKHCFTRKDTGAPGGIRALIGQPRLAALLSVRQVTASSRTGTGDGVTGVAARDLSRRVPM